MQSQAAPAIAQAPTGSPTAVWRAFQAQREELSNQLERYTDTRRNLSQQLEEPGVTGANKAGLEARIVDVDKQIKTVEGQLAEANANVAKAAAVPNAVQIPRPPQQRNGPPEEAFVLGGIFIVVCLLPLSIAFARRIWRKSAGTFGALPTEIVERLTRLDQAVDSIAVEVERIGEGQRFVTRVMSERGNFLGAGPAQPVDAGRGERARVGREGERGA